MSEYLRKSAMLEWHKERIEHWKQFRLRTALERIKKRADDPGQEYDRVMGRANREVEQK